MKTLIIKYLTHNITPLEEEELLKWLENPKNKNTFKTYVHDLYALNMLYKDVDKDLVFNKIRHDIQSNKRAIKPKQPRLHWVKYAAAASILLMVALTIFLNRYNDAQIVEPIIVNNQIKSGSDKATLTLEDGTDVALIKGETYQTQNATSNGEEITYINSASRELVNNYLTTARGEQFQITLADGTQVWLNSETQLKYPVSFTDGESRQVELVYGEAYFDVSPSTDHKGSKFKVFNNAQEVEVLGTEFNIKAYKDETNVYTTLVEGKVAVSTLNANEVLNPGQQSIIDISGQDIQVASVNASHEISWMRGEFIFNRKPLKDIMKVLSRWYDMEVEFDSKDIENIEFTGTLHKRQSIEETLLLIKNTNFINTYEINNKTVTLK